MNEQVLTELKAALTEAQTQFQATGAVNVELKNSITAMQAEINALAQKVSRSPVADTVETKSIGQMFVESPEFKSNPTRTGPVQTKTVIVNAALNTSQPLVRPEQAGLVVPVQQPLTIRSLIPTLTTSSNLVSYAKATFATNAAGLRTTEGSAYNESAFTFALATAPVVSVGHWVPASKESLSDAPMLASFVDTFMRYGLALEEEDEILNGDASSGHMDGLVNQATAATYSAVADNTQLDIIRMGMAQAELAGYACDGIVLHPTDYANIELTKDTAGNYIFGDPHTSGGLVMWGIRVVKSLSMVAGTYLTGNFGQSAAIYDRKEASVEVSTEHSDYFIKDLVAIKATERLALAVMRPAALITGSLDLYA